jgi:hypothetical protein
MNVRILLCRNNNKNFDDIITIRRRWRLPGFIIRYTDADMPKRVWVYQKDHTSTLLYLDTVLTNVINDMDPYDTIQIEIPGYPVAFYKVSTLTETIKINIIESLNGFMTNPPGDFTE